MLKFPSANMLCMSIPFTPRDPSVTDAASTIADSAKDFSYSRILVQHCIATLVTEC